VPEQDPPLQPLKTKLEAATAFNVTVAPSRNPAVSVKQDVLQLIAAGALVMVPPAATFLSRVRLTRVPISSSSTARLLFETLSVTPLGTAADA
jgi:hypothetical protein